MNFIQEVLNLLERKQDKKKLDLKRDWFEFGRTRPSSVGNPLYTPKMNPHAIRFDDLKCNIISGLVSGTGTEHTLPMWSVIDKDNCDVQTMIDSIFSQDAGATEGLVSGNFRVTGDTVLEGNLLVLGTQTIVESTIVQVADNIMQINSGGGAFDAGIEVIQPSGTKTWAWDNGKGLWSTFDDSILTKDINIGRAIVQDGEILVNVVNEAEGLASNDNDESYATVAAIIDWTDQMDLDVSADTGTPLDILLNLETLQIRGGSNITTNADGAEKIRIDLDDDIVVNSVTSKILTLVGAPGAYSVTSIVNTIAATVDANATLATVKAIVNYLDQERDFISNVSLSGNDLKFIGVNNAFSGVVDLSSIGKTYSIQAGIGSGDGSVGYLELLENGTVVNGVKYPRMNEWINIDSDGVNEIQISHKELASPILPTITNVNLGNGDTFVEHSYEFDNAGHVNAIHTVNYTLPTITAGSGVIANPGNPTADLTSIEIDGISYGIASTAADGNDFIDSVTLTGSDLIFTGSGGAFSGTIDLSGLSGTTYTASNGIELVTATEFGLIDVARTDSSSGANPGHTDSFTVIDDVITNTKGQVTAVNVKKVTLPASGTGADGVITDVALNGNDLEFIGSNGGFNGVVDLSGYANAPETVTSLSINANVLTYTDENNADTDIDLSLYLDDTNLARLVSGALDAATGVATFTRDDATTFTLDLSSLLDTDTNDIDYVSGVALNGSNLDFTGAGNAFAGSIDLSALSTTDTNTTYDYGAVGVGGNISLALSGSDGSNDVVTMQAGTNITLTDNGSNTFTIDAAGGVDTDTTYDLRSAQAGSNVDIDLSGSDATVDNITLVAGTNVTLTDDGNSNITIDAASGSGETACTFGTIVAPNQVYKATYGDVHDTTFGVKLGWNNTGADPLHVAFTWTLQTSMTGISGMVPLSTTLTIVDNLGVAVTQYPWDDSTQMVSDYNVTNTYTAHHLMLPGYSAVVQIKTVSGISQNLTLVKGHLLATSSTCTAGAVISAPGK